MKTLQSEEFAMKLKFYLLFPQSFLKNLAGLFSVRYSELKVKYTERAKLSKISSCLQDTDTIEIFTKKFLSIETYPFAFFLSKMNTSSAYASTNSK